MKHSINLLRADIEEELSKMRKVVKEFEPFVPKLDMSGEQVSSYDTMVVGYLLHSFYTCALTGMWVRRRQTSKLTSGFMPGLAKSRSWI